MNYMFLNIIEWWEWNEGLIDDIVERGRSHVRDTVGIKVRSFPVSAMLGLELW